jgi:hypothetical protein
MSHCPSAKPLKEATDNDINHRLSLYTAAAVAAGVGVLALAQPAKGEVIVTTKKIQIDDGPVYVDLNNDGVSDFEFSFASYRDPLFHADLTAKALTGGEVVGDHIHGLPEPYASALVRGAKIGPSAHFASAHGQITIERKAQIHSSTNEYYGHWYSVGSNRYLGVKFLIKGEAHYGWVRMTVNAPGTSTGTITSYAYETIANKRVSAGESSDSADDAQVQESAPGASLGMLALGSGGLALWRVR